MSLKLTTSLSQRLVLTPQLRQRIEMLQMTSLELTDLIQQQLLENPVLEEVPTQEEVREFAEKVLDHLASTDPANSLEERGGEGEAPALSTNGSGDPEVVANLTHTADGDSVESGEAGEAVVAGEHTEEGLNEDGGTDEAQRDAFEEIDFGREFQEYLDPGYKTQEIEYKEDAPTFEQFLTRPPSLADHLEWQVHMTSLETEVADAAVAVIGNLDADGRLSATNEEMAEMEKCSEEIVERARQAVMRLDPVGCGARDVKECLLVQLEVRGESERLASRLISEHFADLQQHRLPHLSKQIGIDVETLLEDSGSLRHRCFGAGDHRKEHDVPLLSLEGRGVPTHDPVLLDHLCSKLGDKPGVDAVRLGVADERDHANTAPLKRRVSNHLSDFCDDHVNFRLIHLPDPPAVGDIQIDQWGVETLGCSG